MPIYYVYDSRSGEIVHQHEAYSVESDESVSCSREEVLRLVDESLKTKPLQILEVDDVHPNELTLAGRTVRVDAGTRALVAGDTD